jgi:pimeloyl-ACP methyl ester carboxylesterase
VKVSVADGVRLNVRAVAGPRSPAFVLVHGLASNARLWSEVAARLADAGHPSYAVDLRGHGDSDRPASGFTTASAAADLAVLIPALGLSGAVVAGQSWGGNVVVALAAEHPSLVSALALIDGGWSDLRSAFGSWEKCYEALLPPEVDGMTADRLRGFLRRGHPDWSAAAVEATVANLRERPDGRLERRLPIDKHMEIVRSMWDDPPLAHYPRLTMPVLLMPARSAAAARRAAALLPSGRMRSYEGGDHDLHAQQPDAVAADLLSLVPS